MDRLTLTLPEAHALLHEESQRHNVARFVDADECRELIISEDTYAYGEACHALWDSDLRCSNCSSYKACHARHSQKKVERLIQTMYEVESKPVAIITEDGSAIEVSLELIDWHQADDFELATVPEKNNQNLHFLSSHDVLTGLLDRNTFYYTVRQSLMENPEQKYLMISLNIRHFHLINDLYGLEKGNEVLLNLAEDTLDIIPEGVHVTRLFGDQFAIFAPDDGKVTERLNRIIDQAKTKVYGETIILQVHAGIYVIDSPNRPVSVMVDRANMARKSIENDMTTRIAYYSHDLLDQAVKRQRLISRFPDALHNGEFVIYLQPQIDKTGNVNSAEALVRWIQDDGSVIPPGEFVPCFEESGQIAKLDRYIWETVVKQLKAWEGTPLENVALSVNVSPKDFQYLNVTELLDGLIEQYGIDRSKLHVEITETALIEAADDVDRIVKAGFRLEIDDFGKGYSSLNTLKNVSATTLKMDMFFLRLNEENRKRGDIIIDHIITMGKQLGMQVIAEGVETKHQQDHLFSHGCDLLQGFLFSEPVPVDEFERNYLGIPDAIRIS